MKIQIARSVEGVEILLTDEHEVCMQRMLPVVVLGQAISTAIAFGKRDHIETDKGRCDAACVVINWLEAGPERSQEARAMAFRFLKDGPEHLAP
jgi:hypothetical protein